MDQRNTPHTHYIHRLSYSAQERMVGAFLLVAIAILVWLLLSASIARISSDKYFILYGELQSEQDVSTNTEIIISGLTAGKVEDVSVNKDNKVVVKLRLLERYHSLVRSDSIAHIDAFNFGVINKSVIELSAGNPRRPLMTDGSHIKIKSSFSIKQLMTRVTPALDDLSRTINQANRLLAAIDPVMVKDSIKNLNAISRNALALTTEIQSGNGIAHQVVYDEAMAKNMLAISNNLNIASAQVDKLVTVLNKELESVPGLMNKVRPLINEADKTIKATQNIWPLSSAIGDQKKDEQLTPQTPAND
jgi:phospholipid/cholesterol/gamma-HCH transport system substrate-binding protein